MSAFTETNADEIVIAERLLIASDSASDMEDFESFSETLVVAQSGALLYSVDGNVDLEHDGIDPNGVALVTSAGDPGELSLLAIATPIDIDSSTIPASLDIPQLHAEELMFA